MNDCKDCIKSENDCKDCIKSDVCFKMHLMQLLRASNEEFTTPCKNFISKASIIPIPKCGSCAYSKPTTWGGKPTTCYVECTNKEHLEKYCKRKTSAKRIRTTPACKSYKAKEGDHDGWMD